MAQVKFYAKSALPSEGIDENGVYFIQGGELYKGSQRFGLGRVTVDAEFVPSTSSKAGQAKGDIVVTGSGAGWVFDGTNWQSIGGDISSLQSLWRADISTWTAGLVVSGSHQYITGITQAADGKVSATASNFDDAARNAIATGTSTSTSNGVTVSVTTTSGVVTGVSVTAPAAKTWTAVNVGDANSYIYNVTQGTDGQVSASAAAFPTLATGDADGQVKLGSTNASVSGWDTVKTDITNLKSVVSYSGTGESVVTASTGNFTNLNVTDTATFSVTNVSATSLTVNGSTIEQIANAQISAIASVTQSSTSNGVTVSVTTAGGSVTAVSVDASAFGNVMKFRGVVSDTSDVTTPASGDIVVIGATPATGFVEGQEYIYDGSKWELIGDQNTYALNAYSSTAAVYAGAATLPAAVSAAGAAIDTLNTNIATKASVGTSTSTDAGITGTVTLASNAAPSITMAVDVSALQTALGLGDAAYRAVSTTVSDTTSTALVTEGAVATALTWITD